MHANQATQSRDLYFDMLRGLAIIFVIGEHTSKVANLETTQGFNFNVLVLETLKIGVPIFLAISGYFLSKKAINGWTNYKAFLSKQLPRVYVPMLLFSIPFIFGNGFSIRSIAGRFILACMGAYSIYYFVFLIAQYYLLLPLLKHISGKLSGVISCAIISIIAIGAVTYCNSIADMDLPLFVYAGFSPVWVIFFSLGCYISIHGRKYTLKALTITALLGGGIALSYLETWYLEKYFYGGLGIKPSVFLYSASGILVLFSQKAETIIFGLPNWFNTLLAHIGRISFTIYLIHIFFINKMTEAQALTNIWYINWLIISIICILITMTINKILPAKVKWLVGL